MSEGKLQKHKNKREPWWRYSRNRNKVWLGLFATAGIVLIAGFIWLAAQGGHGGGSTGDAIPTGQQVQPFRLPDVVSGRDVSLEDYLGKQEIVLVGYMGFF